MTARICLKDQEGLAAYTIRQMEDSSSLETSHVDDLGHTDYNSTCLTSRSKSLKDVKTHQR